MGKRLRTQPSHPVLGEPDGFCRGTLMDKHTNYAANGCVQSEALYLRETVTDTVTSHPTQSQRQAEAKDPETHTHGKGADARAILPVRPRPDPKPTVCQHGCTVETAQSIGSNLSVPNIAQNAVSHTAELHPAANDRPPFGLK